MKVYSPDPCGCTCVLEAFYTLDGVPPGTWTLNAYGDSKEATVQ